MKVGKSINISLVFIIVLILSGCYKPEKNVVDKQLGWSTFEPLSIPYRQRIQLYESGNLVLNPSFEEGRVFLDSAFATFNLKGWKTVGDDVEWIDTVSATKSSEVTGGRYSIKISREDADETEETGVGIMSDFIKVVPGNFQLSFDIRLKNIVSNKVRLGTKIFDAVNIRVYFYDKNKLEISDEMYFPAENKKIDNSFKGYPFSNFREIDSIYWKRMIGRAHHYPFSTGDIPSEARYVKLFFGLKGTGEMWIDNVDFHYTKWNFSTLERMESFADRDFTMPELIVPTPKFISQDIDTMPLFDYENNRFPLIVIPKYYRKEHRFSANTIKEKLEQLMPDSLKNAEESLVKIIRFPNESLIQEASVIINIGETTFHDIHLDSLPYQDIQDKPQGYFIASVQDEYDYIYLSGNSPRSCTYAMQSFLQLIDETSGSLHCASIIDYPGYQKRSFVVPFDLADSISFDEKSIITRSVGKKFNHIYLGYQEQNKQSAYLNSLKKFQSEINLSGAFDFGVFLNPYHRFKHVNSHDSLYQLAAEGFMHSNNADLWQLKKKCVQAYNHGANAVAILSEHYPRSEGSFYDFPLYHKKDKKKFINLQSAHARMINYLIKGLNINDGRSFYFSSPWNNLEYIDKSFGTGNIYYKELMFQLPDNINILWTGTTDKTLIIDEIDVTRISMITGKHPILFDNTLFSDDSLNSSRFHHTYPGKVRLLSMFQPYEVNLPEDYPGKTRNEIIIHQHPENEFDLIKLFTAAEYMWNPAEYHPDLVLWKILIKKYGKEVASELLLFNDYFYELKEISLLRHRPNFQKDYAKKIDNLKERINESYEKVYQMSDSEVLIDLLDHKRKELFLQFS